MYDLLIKGGHVLDPGQNLDGKMDIGITDGKIAAIQPDIPVAEAKRTVEVRGANRRVVPGLIDLHTHVAQGGTTNGVGMACASPDLAGVHSGVTTVVDAGSVGIANLGVFSAHLLPKAKTRVIVFCNVGMFAHTTPGAPDVSRIEEIDRKAIAGCVEANPGLIGGFKLRLVGPVVHERGEEVVRLSKEITTEHNVPLMVHIGDGRAPDTGKASDTTRFLLKTFTEGDILTHLVTPNPGGVMDPTDAGNKVVPEVQEARANGVTLDPASGRGNFGFEVAKRQAQMGLYPDTISSDITGGGRNHGRRAPEQHEQVHAGGLQPGGRGAHGHLRRGQGAAHVGSAGRDRRRPRGGPVDHRAGRRTLEGHGYRAPGVRVRKDAGPGPDGPRRRALRARLGPLPLGLAARRRVRVAAIC